MKLDAYLERIEYGGPVSTDLACLTALHRHHLRAITYENLDVQLRRPLDLDIARIFDKIVVQRRGGWCYEMNGLFDWVLREVGFRVTRMMGGVMASLAGDIAMGNHLVLSVEVDGQSSDFMADVGLGNGIFDPIPIAEGHYAQGDREFRIERIEGELWRFRNSVGAIPPDFDFRLGPADEAAMSAVCQSLQDQPDSMFRQNLICMKWNRDSGPDFLLGRVLDRAGEAKRILEDAGAFEDVLSEIFGVEDREFRTLWPQVCARHVEVFGDASAEDIRLGPEADVNI